MMILNITNKLHFTISEKDAYRSVAMFIYMKMSTYLNGWGNLVCRLSIIMKMVSLGYIKFSMTKVMLTVYVSSKLM